MAFLACAVIFFSSPFPFPSPSPPLPSLSFYFGSETHCKDTTTYSVPGASGQPSDFPDGKEVVGQASPTDPPSTLLGVLRACEVAQRVPRMEISCNRGVSSGFLFFDFVFPTPKEKQKLRQTQTCR